MNPKTLKLYQQKKSQIKNRLKDFQTLTEKQKFQEFQFCLLTPQSNAQRCWSAVLELSKVNNPTEKQIASILIKKTRFHNTKAKRIVNANETWVTISPLIQANPSGMGEMSGETIQSGGVGRISNKRDTPRDRRDTLSLRNSLAKQVNGYGLKEASHFLRNIGLSNNKIAILDRHILRNLKVEKIKSQKHYLEIEQDFLNYAKSIGIPPDELDLLWWSEQNGEIFK